MWWSLCTKTKGSEEMTCKKCKCGEPIHESCEYCLNCGQNKIRKILLCWHGTCGMSQASLELGRALDKIRKVSK